MNMIGDMRAYTQFQAAQSIPIAAANTGGIAGLGAGLGAGMGIGGAMADAMRGSMGAPAPAAPPVAAAPVAIAAVTSSIDAPTGATKFCLHCGKSVPAQAKFCPECGGAQS